MTSEPAAAPRGTAAPGGEPAAVLARDWLAPFPLDVALTLSAHRRGPRDPAYRADGAGGVWRAVATPQGPGTLHVRARPAPDAAARPATLVRARAWGPGASWLLAAVPDLLGGADDPAGFAPAHPRLAALAAAMPGLRVGRTGRVLEALVPAVLEQKVVTPEAHRAWRLLLTWHGQRAPGPAPAGMRVPPPAGAWQSVPAWDWHRAGVEAVRARTIMTADTLAGRLEQLAGRPGAEADTALQSLPGIGPWTAAEVRQRACGDPDAVSTGDYNLPALVGWALAGQPADDAGMLALLAPCRGHRYRATRLIELGGARPPRRGPRAALRDYRAM